MTCTLRDVRKAVREVFANDLAAAAEDSGTTVTKLLEECVYSARTDPGQWAPRGVAVINQELGYLPSGDYYEPMGMEKWFEVSAKLPGGAYVETINAAVSAVYK